MSSNSPPSPHSFLDQSLPDLIRRETCDLWKRQWIGQVIEAYQIEELLGAGTHGVVFRARRTDPFERTAAIKLLPQLQGQTKAKQFQNECQALADLQHPNISQILTAGLTENGTPYLIMPLLNGRPIDEYFQERRGDWSRIAELTAQLASATAFAHDRGIVHCDLKPDNILVDDDGNLTVTDFGLAVRVDEMDDLAQRPSWSPGTIGYAAPEVLTSRKVASPTVDIYSLGAVLYKLLTGDAPHQASGWLDSLVATVEEPPKNLTFHHPDIPKSLAQICERCLAMDPKARYTSAAEVEGQLARFLATPSAPSRPWISGWARTGLVGLFVFTMVLLTPLLLWPEKAQGLLGWNRGETSAPFAKEDVEQILNEIEEQLLNPGLKVPSEPGDIEEVFEILKDASEQLERLLAHAPDHKQVRHRTATSYFLLGRAAHWVRKDEFANRSLARAESMFRELHREYPNDGYMFDFFHTIVVQGSTAPNEKRRDLHFLALGVIQGLREAHPNNLDYSDALACIMVLLAEDYSNEIHTDVVDLDKATQYARRAKALAEWTCRQPGSRPIHRKHIMSSASVLSLISRQQGETEKSLELAEIAYRESIRLDEALKLTDTVAHRHLKGVEYSIALKILGRFEEAMVVADEAGALAQRLRRLDWPDFENCDLAIKDLKKSIRELQELSGQ